MVSTGSSGGLTVRGCGRSIAERGVWALGVVVDAPALDHDLRLFQAVEDLAVEAFIPEFAVEGFAISVLPRTPWFDE